MNFDEYQREARKTAFYPNLGNNLWYPALGLAGESGEVAEKVKKFYRDGGSTSVTREALAKELGDVLWYVANLATELELCLGLVAQANLTKLKSRSESGTLSGSGDNR